MAAHALLDITTGVVKRVSYASESVPPGLPRRPGARLSDEVVNIVRLTLQDDAGATHEFEFRNTTVGVHEDQTLAVVQAKKPGLRGPIALMLVNKTNGQRDEFPEGLRKAASQKGLRARWKALMAAVPIGLLVGLVSLYITFAGQHGWAAVGLGAGAAAFSFVGLWGAIALSDQIRLPALDRAEVQRLRREVHERLFSPPPAPAANKTPPHAAHP
jgi:hypothetical protein